MKVVFTGGGTGGHIYPALEVARVALEHGAEIAYLGSIRGQEGALCADLGIRFSGFPSQPLFSLKGPSGWKALAHLLKARAMATQALKAMRPDAVFSTGGYSAGPVVSAARNLGIPFVIHEQNSAPGRSNLLWGKEASLFAYTFYTTERFIGEFKSKRTGMPIRKALRDLAASTEGIPKKGVQVLIAGGSLGSKYLNETVPMAAKQVKTPGVTWLHLAGKDFADSVQAEVNSLNLGASYKVEPFLKGPEMAQAYAESTLVVGRSGGSVAEFALYGLPSVLVPLPIAAKDHQTLNALEFQEMCAATCLPQATCSAELIAGAVDEWLSHPDRVSTARQKLKSFDAPNASNDLWSAIVSAASRA